MILHFILSSFPAFKNKREKKSDNPEDERDNEIVKALKQQVVKIRLLKLLKLAILQLSSLTSFSPRRNQIYSFSNSDVTRVCPSREWVTRGVERKRDAAEGTRARKSEIGDRESSQTDYDT